MTQIISSPAKRAIRIANRHYQPLIMYPPHSPRSGIVFFCSCYSVRSGRLRPQIVSRSPRALVPSCRPGGCGLWGNWAIVPADTRSIPLGGVAYFRGGTRMRFSTAVSCFWEPRNDPQCSTFGVCCHDCASEPYRGASYQCPFYSVVSRAA